MKQTNEQMGKIETSGKDYWLSMNQNLWELLGWND